MPLLLRPMNGTTVVSVFHRDSELKQLYIDGDLAVQQVSIAPILSLPDSTLRIGARRTGT